MIYKKIHIKKNEENTSNMQKDIRTNGVIGGLQFLMNTVFINQKEVDCCSEE